MAQQKKPIGANGLRIVSLTAENVKKLSAVHIEPSGNMVTIAGPNAAGKSSIIDAIFWAMGGTANIQSQPIRKGQDKARIKLDLGELVVERRFTDKGSTLIVESAEGARFPSPQRMLDDLIGALSFDPHAFMRMDDKHRAEKLREVAQIEIDIDQLDGQIASDFAKRTDVNRDAKAKRSAAEAITVATGLPDQPIDDAAILDRLQAANDENTLLERRKAGREQARAEAQRDREGAAAKREHAQRLRREADELDKHADEQERAAIATEEKLATAGPLPAPADIAAIRVELEHARQVNTKIAARDRRREIEAAAIELEKQAQALTESIDARKQARADAIAAAKMPVAGLGFENGIVTYNGIPFDQASAAEQLTVSFGIAKAANPKLRVISIKDASLLDENTLARIAELAADGDYQVWLERVSTDGKVGIFIEDGMVKAVDGQPVEREVAA